MEARGTWNIYLWPSKSGLETQGEACHLPWLLGPLGDVFCVRFCFSPQLVLEPEPCRLSPYVASLSPCAVRADSPGSLCCSGSTLLLWWHWLGDCFVVLFFLGVCVYGTGAVLPCI